jgi:endonuclease/exonuclease/phosphatase family metal-dependent hydrolase
VVAIQELRTTDEGVMRQFVDLINAEGGAYEYVVGPRLGRSNSKEQYVFVFDTSRVQIDPSSVITVEDPQDHLHREPLIARFQTKTAPLQHPFSFILVNIHTDPDETKTELDALGHVYQAVQNNGWREDDVILLGDLNVSHKKLGLLGKVPDITYTVHGEPTNTRGSKSYDNIVFTQTATSEYTGQSGILNLQSEYGLTTKQALRVSDHHPVWAEFTITENGASPRLASSGADHAQTTERHAPVTTERASATALDSSQPSYETAQHPQGPASRLTGWLRGENDQPDAVSQPPQQRPQQPQQQFQSEFQAETPSSDPPTPRRRRFGFRRSRLFNR